eukprot:g2489.t1
MGGPCMCNGKAVKPGTDNYEIFPFKFEGDTFYSSEHCYQAMKMKSSSDRKKIVKCVPRKDENAWDYGMRVWQKGQLLPKRKDWEKIKVDCMYKANRLKLEQNSVALTALIESNGTPKGPITHRGSGAFWDYWNPVLLMRIREELRPDGDPKVIQKFKELMDKYRASTRGSGKCKKK